MTETVMLIGAGLLCLSMVMALSVIGVVTSERRGVARSVAAIQAMDSAPSVLKQEIEQPFAERVIAPLGRPHGGPRAQAGPCGHGTEDPVPAQRRRQPAGVGRQPHPRPEGPRRRRLRGAGIPLPARPALAVLPLVLATVAAGVVRLRPAEHPALQRRPETRNSDAQRAARRDGPADDLGGGGPGLRRGRQPGRKEQGRSAERGVRPSPAGDADRLGRTEAMRAMAERTSLADLKSFCLAMVQADSLGIPIARVLRIQSPRRCAPSGDSGRRRRRSRCRSG